MLDVDEASLCAHLRRSGDVVHDELTRCRDAVEARVCEARERVLWRAARRRAVELSAGMQHDLLRRAQHIQRQRANTVTALHSLARALAAGHDVAHDTAASKTTTTAAHVVDVDEDNSDVNKDDSDDDDDSSDSDGDDEHAGTSSRDAACCRNVDAVVRCLVAATTGEATHYTRRVCPTPAQLRAFCVEAVGRCGLHRQLAEAVRHEQQQQQQQQQEGRRLHGHDDTTTTLRRRPCRRAPSVDALVEEALALLERIMQDNNDDDDDDATTTCSTSLCVRVPCFVSLTQYGSDVPSVAQRCDHTGTSSHHAAAATPAARVDASSMATATPTGAGAAAALGFLFLPTTHASSHDDATSGRVHTRADDHGDDDMYGDDVDNNDEGTSSDDDDDRTAGVATSSLLQRRRRTAAARSCCRAGADATTRVTADARALVAAVVQMVDGTWRALQPPPVSTLYDACDARADGDASRGNDDDDDVEVVAPAATAAPHAAPSARGDTHSSNSNSNNNNNNSGDGDDVDADDEALASLMDLVRIRYTIELAARLLALDTAKRALLESGEHGALFDGVRRTALCCTAGHAHTLCNDNNNDNNNNNNSVTTTSCAVVEVAVLHLPHEDMLFYCAAYCLGAALLRDAQRAAAVADAATATRRVERWAAAVSRRCLTPRVWHAHNGNDDGDVFALAAAVRVWLYLCEYVLRVDATSAHARIVAARGAPDADDNNDNDSATSSSPVVVLSSTRARQWLMGVAAAATARAVAQSSLFSLRTTTTAPSSPRQRLPLCAMSLRDGNTASVYALLAQHLRDATAE